jgi:hypothetical protein
MGTLLRYQKAGGFLQLLALIETCGKAKQENFLHMIEKEDPRWAIAIKQKMLSIDKILSWSDDQVAEIFARVNEITLATALHGLKPADCERVMRTFSHSQKRKIEDLKAAKSSAPADVSAAFIKVIEEVRSMIKDRYIQLEKFAPEMVIEPEIEDRIGKSLGSAHSDGHAPQTSTTPFEPGVPNMDSFGHDHSPAPASGESAAELKDLRYKVQSLHHENNQLKTELKMLKEKIGQIKKLAA